MDQDPDPLLTFFGNVIDTHTRADALADGTLIDASPLAHEAGLRLPVALTAAVWHDCVTWTDADTERTGVPQDEAGRLWDVLYMARLRCGVRGLTPGRPRFAIVRIARDATGPEPTPVKLDLHIGPGDHGEPVITIMLPEENEGPPMILEPHTTRELAQHVANNAPAITNALRVYANRMNDNAQHAHAEHERGQDDSAVKAAQDASMFTNAGYREIARLGQQSADHASAIADRIDAILAADLDS